jgi:hypothetical protein
MNIDKLIPGNEEQTYSAMLAEIKNQAEALFKKIGYPALQTYDDSAANRDTQESPFPSANSVWFYCKKLYFFNKYLFSISSYCDFKVKGRTIKCDFHNIPIIIKSDLIRLVWKHVSDFKEQHEKVNCLWRDWEAAQA